MISDFKFPSNALHATEFWRIVGSIVILRLLQKRKTPSFLHLPFLLLLNERGLNPEVV